MRSNLSFSSKKQLIYRNTNDILTRQSFYFKKRNASQIILLMKERTKAKLANHDNVRRLLTLKVGLCTGDVVQHLLVSVWNERGISWGNGNLSPFCSMSSIWNTQKQKTNHIPTLPWKRQPHEQIAIPGHFKFGELHQQTEATRILQRTN